MELLAPQLVDRHITYEHQNNLSFQRYARLDGGAELVVIPFLDPDITMNVILPGPGKGKEMWQKT